MPDADPTDLLLLSSAISNSDDLGPFIRKAFATNRTKILHQHLLQFASNNEQQIELLCKAHYQDFIRAVDDLRSLLADADQLKSDLSASNSALQSASAPLLTSFFELLSAHSLAVNLSSAIKAGLLCKRLFALLSRANELLQSDDLYLALRIVDTVEKELLPEAPHPTIRRMLLHHIPAVRSYVERKIGMEFSDWMVQIRVASRHLGQLAIGRAAAARQREEDLRLRQREAEEQSRLSIHNCIYSLHEEDDDDDIAAASLDGALGFDLTPLYRSYHIHQTLGLQEKFKKYYLENRKLQLTSDFQISSMSPFLESHQTFFAQIAGFFIAEDRILRTGGGLIARQDVEALWDSAVAKMVSVLEDNFSRMQTANHLLLIKDYVSLLGVTLRRYNYPVDPLLAVLANHRDKYHDLLLSDCRRQINDAIAADKFDQMLMKREYEYSMNVLSFQIQTSDITPAFPYLAPFSSTVPGCCRIVRSFIEDSVSYMAYGGQLDFYAFIKKYLDRLLSDVLDTALLRIINSQNLNVSRAMQVAANMAVLERACDFFWRHAAQLSGIPLRVADQGRRDFPLSRSRDAAEHLLLELLKAKIDDFMLLADGINWMAEEPPNGNEYASELIIYLETLVSTAQQILPVQVLRRVLSSILSHVNDRIVGLFLSDSLKRFNASAVTGIDTDLRILESFAENSQVSNLFTDSEAADIGEMKATLLEARQLVNLLMSNHPESFVNPVIREKSYNKLDYKKVVTISEKFRDSSDRLFGSFATRGYKQNPKKKSLDALIRRLKDAS